jgi:hypothetical protein
MAQISPASFRLPRPLVASASAPTQISQVRDHINHSLPTSNCIANSPTGHDITLPNDDAANVPHGTKDAVTFCAELCDKTATCVAVSVDDGVDAGSLVCRMISKLASAHSGKGSVIALGKVEFDLKV